MRPRPSQSRALIPLSYGFKDRAVSGAMKMSTCFLFLPRPYLTETVRVERTRAFLPGGLAGRCPDQLGDASESELLDLAEGRRIELLWASKPGSFQDCCRTNFGVPSRNLRQGRHDSNAHRPTKDTGLEAAALPVMLRPLVTIQRVSLQRPTLHF